MPVYVLRLGHRAFRDKRISTHCALVARAFGAEKILYSGERDSKLEESVNRVTENWGGPFSINFVPLWKDALRDFSGKTVHLTMYGMPLQDKIPEIRKEKSLMILIGGEKVPFEAYELSDWNIAVSSQPHSEVAALAVFLHEYFQGKELSREFTNPKKTIIPSERGKKVIDNG